MHNIFYCKTRTIAISTLLLLAIINSISCAPRRMAMDPNVAANKFIFLQDGKVTKEEIMIRMGPPSSTYENERIMIFWWFEGNRKAFNIVVVFNEEGILERHSIVRVR